MSKQAKNIISIILPFVFSAVLLGWLFHTCDYKHIWQTIKSADMGYLMLAAGLYFAINFMIWWRWIILMKAMNLKFKRFSSLRWYLMGQACNLLPISSVGGDVIKGLGISAETGHKSKVFASIVLDRLIGFVAIVLIAFLAFWGGRDIVNDIQIVFSIWLITAVSLAMGIVLFSQRVFTWATNVFKRWPKVREGLMNLHYDVVLLKGKSSTAVVTLLISIAAQMLLAVDYYVIGKALHQEIPFFTFVVFSPLVCVATALPSVGGLGVREQAWVRLLGNVGVIASAAAAISFINGIFMLVFGILGGVFYVATLSVRRVQHCQTSPAVS